MQDVLVYEGFNEMRCAFVLNCTMFFFIWSEVY